MNLQHLRYLVATADHGTMTKAAAACHVAQPALTRAVRTLERELGLSLFSRRGRSVEITAEGRLVVEVARRVLAEVGLIESLGRRAAWNAVVTIAATPTIQADLGSGLISDYWQRYPEFPIRLLHCDSRQNVGEAVASGRADAGVSDLPVSDDLVVVPFESREVVVVAPPRSDLADPLPLTELGGLSLILPTKGSLRRVAFDLMFAELDISPTVVFETDERASWTAAVLAGRGCCVWYRSQGEAAGALGAQVVGLDPPLRRAIAVVHRHGALSPPIAALVQLATERAAAAVDVIAAPMPNEQVPGA